jgi:hypothetical protein
MKKMITTQVGKHPFTLDDLGFLQSAWQDAFGGTNSSFPNAILSGCTLTVASGSWQCSAGYISMNGVIYRVPGHDTLLPAGNANPQAALYWKMKTQALPPSPVVYQNLQSHSVHQEDYAVLERNSGVFNTAVGVTLYSAVHSLKTQIQANAFGCSDVTIDATHTTLPFTENGSVLRVNGGGQILDATFPETASSRIYMLLFTGTFTVTNSFQHNVFAATGSSATYRTGQIGFLYKIGGLALIYAGYEENNSWMQTGLSGQPAFQNGWHVNSPNPPLKCRKDGSFVSIIGSATGSYTGSNGVIFTLPAGYRPQNALTFRLSPTEILTVATNGNVQYTGTPNTNPNLLFGSTVFSVN